MVHHFKSDCFLKISKREIEFPAIFENFFCFMGEIFFRNVYFGEFLSFLPIYDTFFTKFLMSSFSVCTFWTNWSLNLGLQNLRLLIHEYFDLSRIKDSAQRHSWLDLMEVSIVSGLNKRLSSRIQSQELRISEPIPGSRLLV